MCCGIFRCDCRIACARTAIVTDSSREGVRLQLPVQVPPESDMSVGRASGFFVLRQVPVNGNALFSAVAMSRWFIESGEHPAASSPEIEAMAKDLRQVRFADR